VIVGIALICRHDSRRLPGKILRKIGGRTLLEHVVAQIRRGAPRHPLVVATSEEKTDDPISLFCDRIGLPCFRGSLIDVAGRFLACAQHYGWQFGVRINGDNAFVDSGTLISMLELAETGEFDFVTNVPGRTFPYGMSVEIVRTTFYADILGGVKDLHHREHVTSWLYHNPGVGRWRVVSNLACPEGAGLQLAIDTEDDLERARYIVGRLSDESASGTLRDIVLLAREWQQLREAVDRRVLPKA
jgi:spore coat polysaccharide biosynthesis protein SpsF